MKKTAYARRKPSLHRFCSKIWTAVIRDLLPKLKFGQILLPTVDFFDIIRIWHILALQKAAPKVREEVKE